jgi:hypothetical protein
MQRLTNKNFFLNIHTEGSERDTDRADKKASRKVFTALRTYSVPLLYMYTVKNASRNSDVDNSGANQTTWGSKNSYSHVVWFCRHRGQHRNLAHSDMAFFYSVLYTIPFSYSVNSDFCGIGSGDTLILDYVGRFCTTVFVNGR